MCKNVQLNRTFLNKIKPNLSADNIAPQMILVYLNYLTYIKIMRVLAPLLCYWMGNQSCWNNKIIAYEDMTLINKIISDCPKCNAKNTFGNVGISQNTLSQSCKSCKYKLLTSLPELNKKVIYLDQQFLSNAFKKKDERFIKLIELILDLINKQLIICPYSNIHEIETHLWNHSDQKKLWDFLKQIARGHEFESSMDIKNLQISRAISAFLQEKDIKLSIDLSDAMAFNRTEWNDYYWIDIEYEPIYNMDELNISKDKAVEFFIKQIPVWQQDKNIRFRYDYKLEINHIARYLIDCCTQGTIALIQQDYDRYLNMPESAEFITVFEPFLNTKKNIIDFLMSPYFSAIPFIDITACLYALLKKRIINGWLKKLVNVKDALSGVWFDIEFLSVYAPYCDAVFTDRTMHE